MSLNDLKCIRSLTKKPLDVHLMVEHPINTIDLFIRNLKKGDTIYIHPEAEYHPSTTLQRIIDAGIIPGIAINPGTSIEEVKMLLRTVKKVLGMSVNPGNASQMFLPYVREKYDELLALKDQMQLEIYWDGACRADKIKEYAPLGVKGFVLGTTLLFGKNAPYGEKLDSGMGGEKAGMSDQPVAVCGLGPIGLMTAMLLKEAGFAQLYLVGNKDSQIERGKALGIPGSHFCDSRKEDAAGWLKEVSKGGVAAFFECVGKNECVSAGIKAAAPKGRLILVGNPHSDMHFSRDIYWEILRKQMTLQGIWNSVFRQNPPENEPDDWNRVMEKITEGKIRPAELISHRFALEDLEKGLLIMRDKSEDYCKVMIRAE